MNLVAFHLFNNRSQGACFTCETQIREACRRRTAARVVNTLTHANTCKHQHTTYVYNEGSVSVQVVCFVCDTTARDGHEVSKKTTYCKSAMGLKEDHQRHTRTKKLFEDRPLNARRKTNPTAPNNKTTDAHHENAKRTYKGLTDGSP